VSLEGTFTGEDGRERRLRELMDGKPTVLSLAYYHCASLCPEVLSGLGRTLRGMSLEPGKDFALLTVSFDPRDSAVHAARGKTEHAPRHREWRFLTGNEVSIDGLTRDLGFRYVSDPGGTSFAHPAVVVVLTGDGLISRYFYDLDLAPRDLQLALVEASQGRIGSALDRALLYCFHYDPATGRYGLVITRAIQTSGLLTVLAIAGLLVGLSWKRR
jgi:protein SCO1/2